MAACMRDTVGNHLSSACKAMEVARFFPNFIDVVCMVFSLVLCTTVTQSFLWRARCWPLWWSWPPGDGTRCSRVLLYPCMGARACVCVCVCVSMCVCCMIWQRLESHKHAGYYNPFIMLRKVAQDIVAVAVANVRPHHDCLLFCSTPTMLIWILWPDVGKQHSVLHDVIMLSVMSLWCDDDVSVSSCVSPISVTTVLCFGYSLFLEAHFCTNCRSINL